MMSYKQVSTTDISMKLEKVILILMIATQFSCGTDPEEQFVLTLEEVSCTEAWLKVEGVSNTGFILERDNEEISGYEVYDGNTIYDDSLQPNTSYTYRLITQDETSSEVTATTLDTTSHEFTWQSWTFGEHSSSMLYDVAIIDENNIWAVGKIYMYDSTGAIDQNAYNAVHWDGNKWELKRILYYGECSAVKYPPLKAIWAYSEEEIIITNGGSTGLFNGDTVKLDCGVNSLLDGAINAIWGTSNNDIYVVGNNGSVVHYDGNKWTKIESGTELDIQDIWGETDPQNDTEVLCIASDMYQNNGYSLIEINNNSAAQITTQGLPWSLHSIWFIKDKKYFLAGDGYYYNHTPDNSWQRDYDIPAYYKDMVRGTGFNNIVLCGSYGLLSHYNGQSWKHYMGNELPYIDGRYSAVNITENLIAAVGYSGRKAFIVFGKK